MKNFAKLFVVAVVVTLLVSVFAVPSAASTALDPHTLKPGSDAVYFIMDPAEGQELPGDGSGKDAENPLKPIDHERFDPTAEANAIRNDFQTSWYQAIEFMKDTGGTLVICGPLNLGPDDTYGAVDQNNRDICTPKFGTNTIKITSVYNGVDYRETNGAKLTVELPAGLSISGQTIWENIDIETIGANRLIAFNDFPTLVGEGVKCYPKEPLYAAVPSYYVSLSAGHRYEGGADINYNLVVQSGTYNMITATLWGVTDRTGPGWTYNNEGITQGKVTLEGTTKVVGGVYGTPQAKANFSGSTEIIINGGTYECDLYGVGPKGMTNKDGLVTFRISGGDFSKAWGINPICPGYENNAPIAALIDFSGWTGTKEDLAVIYNLAQKADVEFTTIQLPAGIEAAELESMTAQTTPPPVVETTAPTGDTTTAPNSNNGPLVIGGDDETDASVGVGGNNGGSNMGLIIGIVAGVVVIAAVIVVVIVLGKKKKENK